MFKEEIIPYAIEYYLGVVKDDEDDMGDLDNVEELEGDDDDE